MGVWQTVCLASDVPLLGQSGFEARRMAGREIQQVAYPNGTWYEIDVRRQSRRKMSRVIEMSSSFVY